MTVANIQLAATSTSGDENGHSQKNKGPLEASRNCLFHCHVESCGHGGVGGAVAELPFVSHSDAVAESLPQDVALINPVLRLVRGFDSPLEPVSTAQLVPALPYDIRSVSAQICHRRSGGLRIAPGRVELHRGFHDQAAALHSVREIL